MSEKESFADMNPFLRLREKSFPRRESPSAVSGEDIRREEKYPCAITQDEDSRLFLQAVRALPLQKNSVAPHTAPVCRNLPKPQAGSLLRTDDASNTGASPEDEHALDFAEAMLDVRPLHSKRGRDVPRDAEPPAAFELQPQSFQELLKNTLEFSLSFSEEYIEGHVVGLDSLILQKLRAGQYSPEAHLDLHGLNARQAFDAMVGFVRRAWYRSLRTVLLIPGRGRNSPAGVGVLRERVQSWLTQDPFKRVVLAFCTAKSVDGGPGSLYILLRKYKKKGKVHWERCPMDLEL
jgi:DNA-nicking Smr family endonuclease